MKKLKICFSFLSLLALGIGQIQFQGYYTFIGFVDSPANLHGFANSMLACSLICLRKDDCYFFDFCESGPSTICYFHDNDVANASVFETGVCLRYGMRKSCHREDGGSNLCCKNGIDNNGWTVIQRRVDGVTDFYRNWSEYENGFGNPSADFYLGNHCIHKIVKKGDYELRVDLKDHEGNWSYAGYRNFLIGGAKTAYTLDVSDFHGNAGDSLTYHSGMPFSTYDNDNDNKTSNCAASHGGAWWYKSCHFSNLNGQYGLDDPRGIIWYHWLGYYYSLNQTQMMVRKKVS
ncbi:microfibril-associated glycoprotein 4-like [Crassostrea virginica]